MMYYKSALMLQAQQEGASLAGGNLCRDLLHLIILKRPIFVSFHYVLANNVIWEQDSNPVQSRLITAIAMLIFNKVISLLDE